jgi:hypothetical protein
MPNFWQLKMGMQSGTLLLVPRPCVTAALETVIRLTAKDGGCRRAEPWARSSRGTMREQAAPRTQLDFTEIGLEK